MSLPFPSNPAAESPATPLRAIVQSLRSVMVRSGKLSVWLATVALRVATMLLGVLNVVVIARSLGPAEAGQYFVFVSVVMMLAVVAEIGMSQSASVFPSIYPSATAEIHRTILKFTALLSAGAALVGGATFAAVGRTVLPSIPAGWMAVVAVALPLALYGNIWNGFVIGLGRVVVAGTMQMLPLVLSVILNITLLAILHGGALTAILIYTVVLLIQVVGMFLVISGRVRRFAGAGHPAGLGRQMITFGLRGYAGGMSSFLWMRATTFLLEAYHGPLAVGVFSVAQQITERVLLPVQVVKDVVYREISSAERDRATWLMNRYLRVALGALVPVIAVVALLTPRIIHLLFGARYDRSIPVCQLMFIGSSVMIIPTVLTPYFVGQLRRPGLLSWLAWLNVMINGVLAFWLVPGRAEIGGAIALVGTQLIGTAIVFVVYMKCAGAKVGEATVVRLHDLTLIRRQLGSLLRQAQAGAGQ